MFNFAKFLFLSIIFMMHLAHADDLFDTNLARDYKPTSVIKADSTIGGYPIFQGGRTWYAVAGKSTLNNLNMRLAEIHLVSPMNNDYFSEIFLMVNLEQRNAYFSIDVCSTPHLFKLNKGGGYYDNCLTIDPYIATIRGKSITTLDIHVRNSQQASRIYNLHLLLNLSHLGFSQTEPSDWSEQAVEQDVKKKELIDKVTVWAKKLQEGVNTAIDFKKSLDAFANVPPINDLVTTDSIDTNSGIAAQTRTVATVITQ